jgi:hypothetical protein
VRCPNCKSPKSKVVMNWPVDWVMVRIRQCLECDKEFETQEKVAIARHVVRDKVWARSVLGRAVQSGEIIVPKSCSECAKTCRPEGHHEDYSKPLDVVWLCKSCHVNRHHSQENLN